MDSKDDFYLDERGLASYFEASWLDRFRDLGNQIPLTSASRIIPEKFIHSPFFVEVAKFAFDKTQHLSPPTNLLEIGPALGRTCYETLRLHPSIIDVTVVEPSNRLLDGFRRILIDGGQRTAFPYIHSLTELGSMEVDTSSVTRECRQAAFTLMNEAMTQHTISEQFDRVYCLNVIDNANNPMEIVQAAQRCTKPGGALILACTYQWSKKFLESPADMPRDINELFDSSWVCLGESKFEYKFRFNERFWRTFSSHIVIYEKNKMAL